MLFFLYFIFFSVVFVHFVTCWTTRLSGPESSGILLCCHHALCKTCNCDCCCGQYQPKCFIILPPSVQAVEVFFCTYRYHPVLLFAACSQAQHCVRISLSFFRNRCRLSSAKTVSEADEIWQKFSTGKIKPTPEAMSHFNTVRDSLSTDQKK